MKLLLNRKGQFSIIAALLVAVVLVGATMTTYSMIRYNPVQEQPQILSAVDETNLGLKEILGFTVGYYGSILKVTGNQTYAQQLSRNYLQSGLDKVVDVRPEWGTCVNLDNLTLKTNWFGNQSYSQGNMTVSYDLNGLGISGATYSTSTRLDVQVLKANATNEAQLKIMMDDGQPLINLGKSNLQFCRYNNATSSWELVEPTNIASYIDGSYVIDLPVGVIADSYLIQVQDTRGLMVLASSFSCYTSTVVWNSSSYQTGLDYVDNSTLDLIGSHSNFTAQQFGPDGIYDTLTEATNGTTYQPSYPTNYNLYGQTTLASGTLTDLQTNNGVYMSFHSYANSFSGSATLGYTTKGNSNYNLNYVRGSRFTMGASSGLAGSISANLVYSATSNTFGNTNTGTQGSTIIDTIRGQRFTPSTTVTAQSISAYIACTTSAKNMNAALYDSNGNLIGTTEEKSIPTGTAWQTFNFAAPPTLTASAQYTLVVWSQSGTGTADLRYSSTSGGNGRTLSQTYGSWPATPSFSSNAYQYSIYCNYQTTFNAQAAIYSSDGSRLIATTEEKTYGTTNGWVTFNFITQPTLIASTSYVLAIETSDTSVTICYDSGTTQQYRTAVNYPAWPTTITDQGNQRQLSIYCTYSPANQHTAQVELVGNSTTPLPWNALLWTIDSSASTSGVTATFQLYNATAGQYPLSGDGFMSDTLGSGDLTKPQTILTKPADYLNSSGYWKIMITTVKATGIPFDLNLDFVQYSPNVYNYAINLQEQWLNVNATNIRQDLCIKTGAMNSTEPLMVQVWHGGAWQNLTTLTPNYFNNASLAPYIDSANLTIRFVGSNDLTDITQDSWNIDAIFLKDERDVSFLVNLLQPTLTVEVLQNGTMRWLGQNLQSTTQALPIPPVPVKAIHINETISGANQEVPFQIEDWASEYQIPLGLTSNTTVFSNRQMIVFLLNSQVTNFTIWWDGSDSATQTSLAYTDRYFTSDNPVVTQNKGVLTNGVLTLTAEIVTGDPVYHSDVFKVTSTVGGASSTSTFMRINRQNSTYGAGQSYVIHHGIVRDVIQQESEWSNGATTCPNLYASIVLTLPANASYFTYQLRMIYINSSQQRTLTDLCPILLTTSLTSIQTQTENGTLGGFPTMQNGTGTFSNYTSGGFTAHHFSQLISSTGKGAGILFTDKANRNLYAMDAIAGQATGALNVNAASPLIELSPVNLVQVQFRYAYDITWQGAVATFDGTTPVCSLYDGTTPMGLWILAEYPPTLTVTAKC